MKHTFFFYCPKHLPCRFVCSVFDVRQGGLCRDAGAERQPVHAGAERPENPDRKRRYAWQVAGDGLHGRLLFSVVDGSV